jgi:hypothetical protein
MGVWEEFKYDLYKGPCLCEQGHIVITQSGATPDNCWSKPSISTSARIDCSNCNQIYQIHQCTPTLKIVLKANVVERSKIIKQLKSEQESIFPMLIQLPLTQEILATFKKKLMSLKTITQVHEIAKSLYLTPLGRNNFKAEIKTQYDGNIANWMDSNVKKLTIHSFKKILTIMDANEQIFTAAFEQYDNLDSQLQTHYSQRIPIVKEVDYKAVA